VELIRQIFQYSTAFSTILPFIAGIWLWKRLDIGLRILTWSLFVILLFDLAAMFLALMSKSNAFVLNIYAPIELFLFFLVFYLWSESVNVKRSLLATVILFFIFWLLFWRVLDIKEGMYDLVLTVESVLFVFFSVIALFSALNNDKLPVVKNPIFWVSSALLIYFAGNLFVFALIKELSKEIPEQGKYIWIIHSLLNLTKNLFFLGGFLTCRKHSPFSSAVRSSS